jgi:hypothetical protein
LSLAYYVDHRDGRMTYPTAETVAKALLTRGSGAMGVLIDHARTRPLNAAELRRIGQAIERVRIEHDRELGDENAGLAALLGLAA